jgi:hypothetical protein
MFNAKPLQVGFVLLQSAYGFVAFHKANIANPRLRFHDFRLTSSQRMRLHDGVRCRSPLVFLVDDCATPGRAPDDPERLAGHAVGAGRPPIARMDRLHDAAVQLPDFAHAARERGAIGCLGQCNRPRGSEHGL